LVKIEAAVVALTVTAVETFASVMGVATADGDGNGGQNRVATKVSCNKEGGGDGGKSDGNEGGGRVTATAMTWAMAMAMRLAGDEEGECKGGTFNSNGDEDRWQWQQPPLKPFQRWQRPQQLLWQWQTTTETAGAGNNQQVGQGAAVEAVTAAVPVAIVAARLRWQVGAWWSRGI
jgi:hypothetical protein